MPARKGGVEQPIEYGAIHYSGQILLSRKPRVVFHWHLQDSTFGKTLRGVCLITDPDGTIYQNNRVIDGLLLKRKLSDNDRQVMRLYKQMWAYPYETFPYLDEKIEESLHRVSKGLSFVKPKDLRKTLLKQSIRVPPNLRLVKK